MKTSPEKYNQFDRIAWVYEPLARLVFGDKLLEATVATFPQLRHCQNVLLIGGGTGHVLPSLWPQLPAGASLTYVEASKAMLQRAKRHAPTRQIEVNWQHSTHLQLPQTPTYDAIVTPFFLDVFAPENLPEVIDRLKLSAQPEAHWLLTDFYLPKEANPWDWRKRLVALMYVCFRWTCRLEGSVLLPFGSYLMAAGFKLQSQQLFFHDMVLSAHYRLSTGH